MTRLLRYLVLPPHVTPFEERYLRRLNKIALIFFWLHPPVFALVAFLAGTSIPVALGLALAVMVGPAVTYAAFNDRPRLVSTIYGVTAMLMGGALVYIGQGPMQIEMHFYFFVLIALLAVFGNPMVILTATVTVALHHFAVWLLLPRGVFNYEASFWTVAVHAIFVVIESVAAVFVARSFFDNVIGLEAIVTKRTAALDGRNKDMAMILDNVAQGFVSVGLDGAIGGEWSAALATWCGTPTPGSKIWDYLFDREERRAWMRMGFDSLVDGMMPVELVIDQLPRRLERDGRELRVDYRPVNDPPTSLLVVVSDISAEVAREHAERVQRELIAAVEKAFRDRVGFSSFVSETDALVRGVASGDDQEIASIKRQLHTLKGNAALFGVTSVSSVAHDAESAIDESGQAPGDELRANLLAVWSDFRKRIERVLGPTDRRAITIPWEDYQEVVSALPPAAESPWAQRVRAWGAFATRPRLEQSADYARALAGRLGKPEPEVQILDHGVRLDGDPYPNVWSAFVHAVRNMVDHGMEPADVRLAAGKAPAGKLTLETTIRETEMWIEIADDGPGIDWARVAEKARSMGLPADTQAELQEAIFASGVSTAAMITDVSGRGVGLDALRTACREAGGRVQIVSELGHGTRLSCVLPLPRSRVKHSTRVPAQKGAVAS